MVTGERKHCFIFPLFEEKWNSVLSPQGVRAVQELLFLLNLLPFICRHPLRSWEGGQDLQPRPSYSGDIAFIINAKKFHPNCVREFLMKAWVKTESQWGVEMGWKSHELVFIVRTRTLVLDNAVQLRTVAESQLHWLWKLENVPESCFWWLLAWQQKSLTWHCTWRYDKNNLHWMYQTNYE